MSPVSSEKPESYLLAYLPSDLWFPVLGSYWLKLEEDQLCLCSARMQVQSLVQERVKRTPCCHSWCVHYNCGSDLIPGLGTPYAVGRPKKNKEKKKEKNLKKNVLQSCKYLLGPCGGLFWIVLNYIHLNHTS